MPPASTATATSASVLRRCRRLLPMSSPCRQFSPFPGAPMLTDGHQRGSASPGKPIAWPVRFRADRCTLSARLAQTAMLGGGDVRGPAGPLEVATGRSIGVHRERPVRSAVLWRMLLVGTLISLLGGAWLSARVDSERASTAAVGSHANRQAALSSLPAAALGPVSATLGAAEPSYRLSPSRAGVQATHPSQTLNL